MSGAFMWIPVGLLDRVESKVVAHICCASKAEWDTSMMAGAKCYCGIPEDIQAFVKFLRGEGE